MMSQSINIRRISCIFILFVLQILRTTPALNAAEIPASPKNRWSMFRGNHAMTGVSAGSLAANPKLLWRIETKSSIDATAAIADGAIYIGTMDGQFLALRLTDGGEVWKFISPMGDPIQSSACVSEDLVYFGDGAGAFRAMDRKTGKPRWEFKADSEIISSPIVVNGAVLFGSYDEHLYALDAATGKERWRFRTSGPVHCSPSLVNGQVAVAGCDGFVRLVAVADGKETRSLELGGNIASTPAVLGNRFFLGTMGNQVVCIDAGAMQRVWEYENKEQQFPFFSSPAVTNDLVLIGGRDKQLHALEQTSGKRRWAFRAKGRIDSPAVVVGTRGYFGSHDGSIYGVNLATGKKEWEHVTGAPIVAGPAIADERLIVGDQDGRIYCFGE